jgi:pimeloyl-ACP methyl ester carboxylesterase
LVVWGEKDKIVPVKYAHIFKEKIKDCRLEILPEIGHSPHLEVPEKLAQIIVSFLKY